MWMTDHVACGAIQAAGEGRGGGGQDAHGEERATRGHCLDWQSGRRTRVGALTGARRGLAVCSFGSGNGHACGFEAKGGVDVTSLVTPEGWFGVRSSAGLCALPCGAGTGAKGAQTLIKGTPKPQRAAAGTRCGLGQGGADGPGSSGQGSGPVTAPESLRAAAVAVGRDVAPPGRWGGVRALARGHRFPVGGRGGLEPPFQIGAEACSGGPSCNRGTGTGCWPSHCGCYNSGTGS